MMNLNQNKQCFVLEPGKKIEYLEGEILSIQLSQWGITGKLKVENESYYYKLKDLDMMKYILIGMDLIIYNGFCFKNKKGDVVITDGKFGKTDVQIVINRYYNKKENENAIITGIVKSINNASSVAKIEIEQFFPFKKNYYCLISDEEKGKFNNIMEQRVFLIGKIARLNISYQNQERFLDLLEILPENHFWYKFNEIEKGCSENI